MEVQKGGYKMIEQAIQFALAAHDGAFRKGTNLPYILHPLEAMTITAHLTKDPEVIAAAVLHDVVEDTSFTIEDIRERFGSHVAELVDSCTEKKRRELPASETWMIRKQETIEHLKTASREEKIIAFSDKLSNLRSIVKDYITEGETFWNRFAMKEPKKHVWYFKAMIELFEELDDSVLFREYVRLCRMLRMRVQEYEDFGKHDIYAVDVIASPNSGYWFLQDRMTGDILQMTEEELIQLTHDDTER